MKSECEVRMRGIQEQIDILQVYKAELDASNNRLESDNASLTLQLERATDVQRHLTAQLQQVADDVGGGHVGAALEWTASFAARTAGGGSADAALSASVAEWMQAMSADAPSPAFAAGEAFARIDANHDGVISKREFASAFGQRAGLRQPTSSAEADGASARTDGEERGGELSIERGSPTSARVRRVSDEIAAPPDLGHLHSPKEADTTESWTDVASGVAAAALDGATPALWHAAPEAGVPALPYES